MSLFSRLKNEFDPAKITISRKKFAALFIHWALLMLAVPLVSLVDNMRVFFTVLLLAMISFFVLAADLRGTFYALLKRPTMPRLKRFATILCVFFVLLSLFALVRLVLPDSLAPENGCIKRAAACAILAAASSFNLLMRCHADEIE